MVKTSDDLIKLTSFIKETDNIEATLGQFMWGNCKACHNKYREEH
jgi:cytochrome c556